MSREVRERHLLISSPLGPMTGHAYLVRRNGTKAEDSTDFNYVANMLSDALENTAKQSGERWLAMLLSTELDAEAGHDIQSLIIERIHAHACKPLDRYRSGEEHLFISAWLMPSDDPACEKLMDLH